MPLQPIGDKVLIKPDPPLEKHGSLFLPQTGEYKPRYGQVLAVGPGGMRFEAEADGGNGGLVRVPLSVRIGDRVAFSQYGTDGIETADGAEVLIISESRVLAVDRAA